MRDPRWYLARLRAMPPAEVLQRTWRLARHPADRLLARAGWYSRMPRELEHWHGPDKFYFPRELSSAALATEWIERANQICAGRREVLGLGWLELGDAPWHLEPRVREQWPRVDARRVLSAAPRELDGRLTWELNRGHEWVVLARAFAATRDSRYRDRLELELGSWSDANPVGIGINWVHPMEAAIRIHAFAWIAGLIGGDARLARLIHEHASFVARNLSAFSSANNHRIVELSGLAVAGRLLGQTAWSDRAIELLELELERQFLGGVNAEMATAYHALTLEAYLLVAYLERAHGCPRAALEHAIAEMGEYLDAVRYAPCGLLAQGDGDDGIIVPLFRDDYPAQLVAASRGFASAARNDGGPADRREGVFWLCRDRAAPVSAPARSRVFERSGQVVLRGPRMAATFDAGPFGYGALAAHAHCDALAVNVALDGGPLLVDRGTYAYNGAPEERAWFRSTRAHNTVQVGDREQATSEGPFLWSTRPTTTLERCDLGDGRDLVQAKHDGFHPHVHRRTVVRTADALVIVDQVQPDTPYTARFHFAPGLELREDSGRLAVIDATSARPRCWLWTSSERRRITSTDHSDRYASRTAAPTVECSGPGGTITTALCFDSGVDAAAIASALTSR